MERHARVVLVPALIILLLGIPSPNAAWQKCGVQVCTAEDDQYDPRIISDGFGGIIITWIDYRAGYSNTDIYAQRIDADGNMLWGSEGVAICTATGNQDYIRLVPDGAGGAIISWKDERMGYKALFAQHVFSNGVSQWQADGDTIIANGRDVLHQRILPDGAGGAVIVWMEYRTTHYDHFAQRIDADGSRLWDANGIAVCAAAGNQDEMEMISDGSGGFIITWYDRRTVSQADIYTQKIDTTGTVHWTPDGVAICTELSNQYRPDLATDGAGGAIISWYDQRNGDFDVYAQRVNSSGVTQWAADGIPIAAGSGNYMHPRVIFDDAGAVIIMYSYENFVNNQMDIFAQRVDASGSSLWPSGGAVICPGNWEKYASEIVPDGSGGAIVLFSDYRNQIPSSYVQKLTANGALEWNTTGVPLCDLNTEDDYGRIVGDGNGGIFVAWAQEPFDYSKIFATWINSYGHVGNLYSPPFFESIADVPSDQGGKLSLRWARCDADTLPSTVITHYSVWRLLPEAGSLAFNGNSAVELPDLGIDPVFDGAAVRRLASPAGDAWEWLENVPARHVETYALTVESLYDSIGSDPGWQYFVVTAHTEEPSIYFDSPVDSGYSVDNLSPVLPEAFAGRQSIAPPGLHLSWDMNAEPDLLHYAIYKGAAEDFTPDESNLLSTAYDTVMLDDTWVPADDFFYKLSAVDVHGNVGPAALLRPEDIYVGTLLQSFSASWTHSRIELSWRLSEAGEGILFFVSRADRANSAFSEMSDPAIVADGLSFTFRDDSCEPDQAYRYRVEVSDEEGRKILFETDEIQTPAMPLTLFQNVPNPFNPSTAIRYYLPRKSRVTLDIYDISGRRIAKLVEKEQNRGYHTAEWNGRDGHGNAIQSGVYFYRLVAGKKMFSRKMILLR